MEVGVSTHTLLPAKESDGLDCGLQPHKHKQLLWIVMSWAVTLPDTAASFL